MTDSEIIVFCRQVRKRSQENRRAIALLQENGLTGTVIAILRQELDSMVRCIFLLSVKDRPYRNRLIEDSVNNRLWYNQSGKGKITDKDMVNLSKRLHGWTEYVYKFGCAFIHLSGLHDYSDWDPLGLLTPEDHDAIGLYLRQYHGVTINDSTTLRDIEPVLPRIFEKIASNLEFYIKDLESDADLDNS